MKTVRIIVVVVFALVSFNSFACSTTDKEPLVMKAWGGIFGNVESSSKIKETPVSLPKFNFGNAEDIDIEEANVLKAVNDLTLPEFRFTNEEDINVKEVEALKEVKTISLPLFNAGSPEDINTQEIEALKRIVLN